MHISRWIIGLLTAMLLGLGMAAVRWEAPAEEAVQYPELLVWVETEEGLEKIHPWKDGDGSFYVFLPGYARMESVSLVCENAAVAIDGAAVWQDRRYELNRAYSLTTAMGSDGTITFLRSGGLPSLYLDTASGSMEFIHLDKTNEEAGALRLYDARGNPLYCGALVSVKGRGNTSWYAEKKPYNLTLQEEADLLGMGTAQRWVLLAEGYNDLNIRNKIVYDFAAAVGMPYSPDCRWVEVYLNGNYAGLYLLSERNEVHVERIDIAPEGSMVVSLEYESSLREQKLPYIVTEAGQALRVRHGAGDIGQLQMKWQSVENAILSQDSMDPVTGKHLQELIDLDSWAGKYLIEEVFANMDAGSLSQYYYCDGSDPQGRMYAGPVWDYDFSMGGEGVWLRPYTAYFTMNRRYVNAEIYTPWYAALCEKELFMDRVRALYAGKFLPLLEELADSGVAAYARSIAQASALDSIRWGTEPDAAEKEAAYIRSFLKQRTAFLTDLWLADTDYHTVCVDTGRNGLFGYFAVKDGQALPPLPDARELGGLGWYQLDTGEPFDVSAPVREDAHIYVKKPESGLPVIHYVPLAAVTVLLPALMFLDRFKRKRNGRKRDDTAKTNKIPA